MFYSKYGAKKTIVDGIKFDSKKESEYYKELKELESKGLVSNIRLQVPYDLVKTFKYKGNTIRGIKYVADFVYINDKDEEIVVDVKSSFTSKDKVYTLKKKLLLSQYPDINFEEVIK